jgi:hypothetical protein
VTALVLWGAILGNVFQAVMIALLLRVVRRSLTMVHDVIRREPAAEEAYPMDEDDPCLEDLISAPPIGGSKAHRWWRWRIGWPRAIPRPRVSKSA